jgi:hypothetical protein
MFKRLICDCKKSEIERQKIGLEPLEDFYRKKGESYNCKK